MISINLLKKMYKIEPLHILKVSCFASVASAPSSFFFSLFLKKTS